MSLQTTKILAHKFWKLKIESILGFEETQINFFQEF